MPLALHRGAPVVCAQCGRTTASAPVHTAMRDVGRTDRREFGQGNTFQ
jgi:hypothetical protein